MTVGAKARGVQRRRNSMVVPSSCGDAIEETPWVATLNPILETIQRGGLTEIYLPLVRMCQGAPARDTVVVLNTGDPVPMPWVSAVRSVLEMWCPGQEGGPATADVLLGKADPGGKLPVTFPADATHFPSYDPNCTDMSLTGEVPRAFRTVHPLGWAIWKGDFLAPSEEELLAGIQGRSREDGDRDVAPDRQSSEGARYQRRYPR